ncbi:MAG: hypothetical protein ACLUV8_14285 [Clostridium sp.]
MVRIGNETVISCFIIEDTDETISMILDGMAYYNTAIRPLNVGTNGYIVLKDKNGTLSCIPSQNSGNRCYTWP